MSEAGGRRRAALNFIFITVLLDMLALGIVVPVLPRLVVDFLRGDAARAAEVIGLFATVWALMQLLFSPLLGLLSDRFGRRPVILLSNLGLGLDYLVMAVAPTLRWLFVGRMLSGITSASITAATAYISDVTPVDKRARAFGLIGAAFGVGFVLGPAMGGWLGAHNPRLPFWVAAAFSLLNALYGLLVLPESLAPEKRQQSFRWKDANPLGSLKLLRSHAELLGLAAVNFLGYVAHEVYATVFVLYATYRYHWGERAIGGSLALVGVSSMLTSAVVVGPVVARLGERRTLFAGLLLGAIGFVIFGWARQTWLFLLAIPINCLWGLAGPPSQSMMTQRVSPSEQGELQGALGSVRSIAMLVGPGIFAVTFATFIAPERTVKVPGAPWYLAAALLIVAAALARAVLPKGARVPRIEPVVASLLVAAVLAVAPGPAASGARPAVDVWAVDRGRILRAAAAALEHAPLTVTAATSPRSAGGPHDYFSEADYWWPDPADPSGPFIQRDGMSNPDNFDDHRQAMRRLSMDVPALVAAWKLTGEARYAEQAVRHLRAWFVDEATRMSPDLRYMAPYIPDKKSWPKPPDVMYDREWPMRQASLLFAGLAFKEPSYLELWRTLPADSSVGRARQQRRDPRLGGPRPNRSSSRRASTPRGCGPAAPSGVTSTGEGTATRCRRGRSATSACFRSSRTSHGSRASWASSIRSSRGCGGGGPTSSSATSSTIPGGATYRSGCGSTARTSTTLRSAGSSSRGYTGSASRGSKVDFFDHEAKEVVDLYEAILKDAAEARLLVDFHGANKPTGPERTWPNEMTREGVRGLEYRSTPGWAVHNTTLPFTRFLAGPADYTPVVFGDRRKDTTWAHQIATAVVFTSPVLIYGGHPQSLLDNPAAAVIKAIPSVWDETRVLPPSEIGELAVYARRNAGAWFLGVLNGKQPRTLRVPLSFLGKGRYHATLVSDDRASGAAVQMGERDVTARDSVDVPLRDGGGFVARFFARTGMNPVQAHQAGGALRPPQTPH